MISAFSALPGLPQFLFDHHPPNPFTANSNVIPHFQLFHNQLRSKVSIIAFNQPQDILARVFWHLLATRLAPYPCGQVPTTPLLDTACIIALFA